MNAPPKPKDSQDLTEVSRATLKFLRKAVEEGSLPAPLTQLDLRQKGLDPITTKRVLDVLGQLKTEVLKRVLNALLAERDQAQKRRPRLLWTGPEATGTEALDTRVQLQKCLKNAQRSVLLAGYMFDDKELLQPLYEAMAKRNLGVIVVLDVKAKPGTPREDRIREQVHKFFTDVWPGKDLRPRVYVDPRTAAFNPDRRNNERGYYVSMHAKAVVVDAEYVLVGSANFTSRGTNRNIETGVLLRDREFAQKLLRQWEVLIAGGVLRGV